MAITNPTEYLNTARQDFKNLSAGVCDMMLQDLYEHDGGRHVLMISPVISEKYHARMQQIWNLMAYNILFANAKRRVSLGQRHNMLQNSL